MNSSLYDLVIAVAVIVMALFTIERLQRRRQKIDPVYFRTKWRELQKFCGEKDTWPMAVIDADKLLDQALRKSHFKGKTMGERLMSAQRTLSDNDSVWYGHKLRNKVVHEEFKLKKRDVQDALMGIRQALKDLHAL
ncbi:MAG TPA: hypothetical protein VMR18_04885 [Candidatus Saccharimonadales bacterium]|jgi:hypothetical protein|nr:hypothetical protein [Candidatus Saccharimonadales bacterium]